MTLVASILFATGCGSERSATSDEPHAVGGLATDVAVQRTTLTVDDLPAGWTKATLKDRPEATGGRGLCGRKPSDEREAAAVAEAAFERGEAEQLHHSVAVFKSVKEARASVSEFRREASSCKHWPFLGGGTSAKVRLSPLPFPQMGDETASFRVDIELEREGSESFSAGAGDVVIIRRSNGVSLLLHFAIGTSTFPEVALGVTEGVARIADAKLKAVGY